MAIQIIGAYRSDELPRGHRLRPLRARLRHQHRSVEVKLGPLSPAGVGEICASKRSDARSPADAPNGHGAACALGTGCALQDCSAAGLPAPGGATAAIGVLAAARFFVHPAEAVLRPRDGGPHFARAPPRARG